MRMIRIVSFLHRHLRSVSARAGQLNVLRLQLQADEPPPVFDGDLADCACPRERVQHDAPSRARVALRRAGAGRAPAESLCFIMMIGFESSLLFLAPKCNHPVYLMEDYLCIYGDVVRGRQTGNRGNHYKRYTTADGARAMGIDWMTRDEIAQAIPPAYTCYIGGWLMKALKATR